MPKPTHGAANYKLSGGGKGGWGHGLILSEDQKEYQRAVAERGRRKGGAEGRSMWDDVLDEGMGAGGGGGGGMLPKVGAGRNVNSKRRR